MKRNIADLQEILRLGWSLSVDQYTISNVMVHTLELRREMLYPKTCRWYAHAPAANETADELILLIRSVQFKLQALHGLFS